MQTYLVILLDTIYPYTSHADQVYINLGLDLHLAYLRFCIKNHSSGKEEQAMPRHNLFITLGNFLITGG